MNRPRIHSVPEGVDAELAGALGLTISATCGYQWVPTRFGSECEGLSRCVVCFPPAPEKRGPRAASKANDPHYVYRYFDADGRLIYVGCSNNPVKRLANHAAKSWWFGQVASSRFLVFADREYALSKEREAIATEMPRWNVKGKWPARSDAWCAADYLDLRHAVVQAVETTHGQYGKQTRQLLDAIDAELSERFDVTPIERIPA